MFLWFKKKNNHFSASNDDHDNLKTVSDNTQPQADVRVETDTPQEDAGVSAESTLQQTQYWNTNGSQSHWIDEMYKEQQKKGAFDHLPGKGKPLHIESGDVFTGILKNANVLPDWLQLQQEIREQIRMVLANLPNNDNDWNREIADINIKIKKYNTIVPTGILQKRQIAKETVHEQYNQWL
ncbi:DUF1992 domain-containing protein [Paenibacillus harenae]|uniref:DnaJ family domain-containing protein n=1 Tax=Paenibacillus harenae TaxID=306543 RepID=UPI00041F5B2E|nr:DUF1992 domain-containing protein [Paenibacillus harenae]